MHGLIEIIPEQQKKCLITYLHTTGKPARDYGCIMMLTFATTMTTSSMVKQLPQFYTLLITSPI